MDNFYLLKVGGIMGGEDPRKLWSKRRPDNRMGQNPERLYKWSRETR
ncbi:unnamed protein product [marine sediment metagenome]|uniref:Uncharacterized protein n=1 Tax=marine sediment metagenome TaxID=412755 RepID=X1MSH5_9ZZZZ